MSDGDIEPVRVLVNRRLRPAFTYLWMDELESWARRGLDRRFEIKYAEGEYEVRLVWCEFACRKGRSWRGVTMDRAMGEAIRDFHNEIGPFLLEEER